ncbi:MAG TPA: serine/threonine-protein kinase [Gemmataceae bacterium]|nr:serine/threonine-protein kinase [Gemmataceae bacterium]
MGTDTAKSIGNYDLLEKIAEGGMGAIYRGRHRDSGMIVAIKIMPPHMAQNPVLLKRFEQEFRAASRLDHPNIVRALDYSDNGNTPYLVMEFVEGESLGQKLDREGRMSESEAIRIIAQVAQGLHRAHKQNLVHRDVKPDNILVTPDGIAKLADLGLVKETETDLNLTRTGRGLGTPHFMAPEQFRNAKNADIRCDIYSLGATLYQMVTGELPFRSNGPLDAWMKKIQNELVPPRQIVPGLSERVDWAIRRAMSADPEKRPSSCREFIEDLTGHSTRRLPSVDTGAGTGASSVSPQQELWYLVYKDETGTAHTVKGTMSAVRRSLKDGLLGDASNVRASRSKGGPFDSLRGYPEFRDLVVEAAPLSVPQAPSSRQPVSTTADTVPANLRLSAGKAAPIITPTAPRKPHISLDDIPPSTSGEALKWLFLFVLFVVTAAVAFWFFG